MLFATYNSFTQQKGIQANDALTRVVYRVGLPTRLPENTEKLDADTEALLKSLDQIEFELYYNKTNSVFKIIEKLGVENDYSYQMAVAYVGGTHYTDIPNKKKICEDDSFGQNNYLDIPWDKYKWEITTETKMISGYKCYRAVCSWGEFDKARNKTRGFIAQVWFTPEIPASFGPKGLDGLPGLVLEGKTGSAFGRFYVSKITFGVVDPKIKVDMPKGKYMTEAEYQNFSYQNFPKQK
jgi:GLPGLI family protein